MSKRVNKFVFVAALSLALICGIIAVNGLNVNATDAADNSSTPIYRVTICYTDPDSQEIVSSETVLVSDDGMIFTADEDRVDELCTLTIQHLDSDGQEDEPAQTVPLPVGAAYAVGVPYSVSAPGPDPMPELPNPPVMPDSAPSATPGK